MDLATRCFVQTGQHTQECRLADAVGADQADFPVIGNRCVQTDEDVKIAVRLGEVANRKNGHDI